MAYVLRCTVMMWLRWKDAWLHNFGELIMGLLPDTGNCGLRMHWECRERFPRHRLQRKPLVSGMHHGTCVSHVPSCMSGSLTRGGGENVPGIPGACATRNFTYLVWGPLENQNTHKITNFALILKDSSICTISIFFTKYLMRLMNSYIKVHQICMPWQPRLPEPAFSPFMFATAGIIDLIIF